MSQNVDRVVQHAHHRGADDDAEDRPFAAAQAASAEHRGGDGIQFVEFAETRGLDRIQVERKEDSADAGQQRADRHRRGSSSRRC